MPNAYHVLLSRSALRLERTWVEQTRDHAASDVARRAEARTRGGGGTNGGRPGPSTEGRVVREWSTRSRNNMRWVFSALRWEDIGSRPAMVSLTYPLDWAEYAGDGQAVARHREAFKLRWHRQWGEPLRGVWVREFQRRGAPHLHMYVGLPEAVRSEDYSRLVRRTISRRLEERRVGKWLARNQAGPVVGEFGDWLTSAWSGCVGTDPGSLHSVFGADVAPMFWEATVAEAEAGHVNWGRVADYLWRESGKMGQKTPPEGFAPLGRAWGRWGVGLSVTEAVVSERVAMELRRPMRALVRSRGEFCGPRGRDGLTVFGLSRDDAIRLLHWAEGVSGEYGPHRSSVSAARSNTPVSIGSR